MSMPSSGSSTTRSASKTSSRVGMPSRLPEQAHFLAPLPGEEVDPVDEPHPVVPRAHDDRVRARAVGQVANSAQEVTVRDAGRGDDHVARRELVGGEDLVDVVDPVLGGLLDLAPGGRPELRLELSAQAAERRCREYGLPCPPDADGEVVVRPPDRGRDGGGHVAVLDQLDARAAGADLLDQIVMTRAVEDDRRDVLGVAAERVRDRPDVVRHRPVEVDLPAGNGPDGHLAHVHLRQAREAPGLPHGDHRHRSVIAPGDDAPALQWIDGQVDVGSAAADDRVQGERVVRFVTANDDPPADWELPERVAHRRRGRLLRPAHVPTPEPAGTCQRGALCRASVRHAVAESLDRVHERVWSCARSTSPSTRLITSSTALSMRVFSTTGTPARSARSIRYSWILRMSGSAPTYFCMGRRPSEADSRIQKWRACSSSSSMARMHWHTTAPSYERGSAPGTRWTPSSASECPSSRALPITARTPTSTFRVCSRKPMSAGSASSPSGTSTASPASKLE